MATYAEKIKILVRTTGCKIVGYVDRIVLSVKGKDYILPNDENRYNRVVDTLRNIHFEQVTGHSAN